MAIVGMGEIGTALKKVFSIEENKIVTDDMTVIAPHYCQKTKKFDVLHICFGYTESFVYDVLLWCSLYPSKEVVIHSTVKPGTTEILQKNLHQPTIYSPVRGVHASMVDDLFWYTKFWSTTKKDDIECYPKLLNNCSIKEKFWSNPTSLEYAKILMDTTYYGYLIVFAQHVHLLAEQHNLDEDKLWEFTTEIHQHLGNRPKMFSGKGIGGHCVMQNIELIKDFFFESVFSHNKHYLKHIKEEVKNDGTD